jgi:hypothetical protein
MAAPKLEKHFTMRINLSPEHVYDLKAVRGPKRFIAAIAGGFIRGEGLEAEILPGGADWVSVCLCSSVNQLHVISIPTTCIHSLIGVSRTDTNIPP